MLLGTLAVSFLGNVLPVKGVIRAGEGIIRAGKATNKIGQGLL